MFFALLMECLVGESVRMGSFISVFENESILLCVLASIIESLYFFVD